MYNNCKCVSDNYDFNILGMYDFTLEVFLVIVLVHFKVNYVCVLHIIDCIIYCCTNFVVLITYLSTTASFFKKLISN